MDFLSPFFFGFLLAAVGIALPGMVNMTSVSVSIKQGMRAVLMVQRRQFGNHIPASLHCRCLCGFPQPASSGIHLHPGDVGSDLPGAGIFFFYQALHSKEAKASRRKGSPFLLGMVVAGMNALNIPYFFTMGALLKAEGLIHLYAPYHLFFISGITLSAFIMLSAYARFAQFILKRANYFARNLNYFLSGLFLVLAVVQGVQLYTG